MKNNKNKKMLLIICLVILIVVGVLLYFFVFKKDTYHQEEKILRFYVKKDDEYKEYKYTCKKNNCTAGSVSEEIFYINDDNSYMYIPTEGKKSKVNLKNNYFVEVIKDNDNNPYAIILGETNDYDSNKSIYIIKDNMEYLQNNQYTQIEFLTYEEEDESDYKYTIVDYDVVLVSDDNGYPLIVDYKNNKVVFDPSKLNFKNEDDLFVTIDIFKVDKDKYYYIASCPEGIAYLLNTKFEKILSLSSKGNSGSQFDQGAQILVHNNKLYVVNSDDKSFSIYDINGKQTKRSVNYDYVYCIANGYFLVKTKIEDVSYDVVIDVDGKELFKTQTKSGMDTVLYYDEKENTYTIETITGLDSGYTTKYDVKTGKITEKSYDYVSED